MNNYYDWYKDDCYNLVRYSGSRIATFVCEFSSEANYDSYQKKCESYRFYVCFDWLHARRYNTKIR